MKQLLFLIALLPILYLGLKVDDSLVTISNWVLSFFTVYKLCDYTKAQSKSCVPRFNSHVMLYLFIYFFVCIASLSQYISHVSIWGGTPLESTDYVISNIFFIVGIFSYDFSYSYYLRKPHNYSNYISDNVYNYKINDFKAILISLISVGITILAYRHNFLLLVLREINNGGTQILDSWTGFGNTSVDLLYSLFIRPMPVMVLVCYNYVNPGMQKKTYKLILFLLVLISNFPLALARFYVAAIYIPLLISIFPSLLQKQYAMKFMMILGLMYVFPFLNQGRKVTEVRDVSITISPDYDMFNEGHFDSYHTSTYVFKNETVTYGKQLVGAVFFFIPRSMWQTKPSGSGGYIADKYHFNFDHISLSFWGEGYINFGFIGIILFSILLAFTNVRFDKLYAFAPPNSYIKIGYTVYLGTMMFFLRGDLISSIAYLLGLMSSAYVIHKLLMKHY